MQNELSNFRTVAQHQQAITEATECLGILRSEWKWTLLKTSMFMISLACSVALWRMGAMNTFQWVFLVINFLGATYFLIQGFCMLWMESKWKIVARGARRAIEQAESRTQRVSLWKEALEATIRYEAAEAAGDEQAAHKEYEEVMQAFDKLKPLL